jgi:NAD(P)H dehydrogenase (quinone)
VISGHKPMTVADYVNANRAEFDHDGRFVQRDQLAS